MNAGKDFIGGPLYIWPCFVDHAMSAGIREDHDNLTEFSIDLDVSVGIDLFDRDFSRSSGTPIHAGTFDLFD